MSPTIRELRIMVKHAEEDIDQLINQRLKKLQEDSDLQVDYVGVECSHYTQIGKHGLRFISAKTDIGMVHGL